ncbi:hypothetical protein Ciccas_001309 [Cichlidogyrus casuarinus]|uniref:Uncharacterized protein n=1 Tax=Cichlidogyrus casuarinus TaxID=1844966 RepID=A0ABD2QKP2_9PLAT
MRRCAMTTDSCDEQNLRQFVEETGTFGLTHVWALKENSEKVLELMFMIVPDVKLWINGYKNESISINDETIYQDLEDTHDIYKQKSRVDLDILNAYIKGMGLVLGLASKEFSERLSSETRKTAEELCENVFKNIDGKTSEWLNELNQISNEWSAAQTAGHHIRVTEDHCCYVLTFLRRFAMTTDSCDEEDLRQFVEETGTFGLTHAWALKENSEKVLELMFMIVPDITLWIDTKMSQYQ